MSRFRIQIDQRRRLNRMTAPVDMDAEGLKEMTAALWTSDGFDPAFPTLLDMSRVSLHALDIAQFRGFYDWIKRHDPRTGNVAVVLGDNAANAAIGKMIEALRDIAGVSQHRALRHFTRADEAERWLTAAALSRGTPAEAAGAIMVLGYLDFDFIGIFVPSLVA